MDELTLKENTLLLQYFGPPSDGLPKYKPCLGLPHYATDRNGFIYTTLHRGRLCPPKLITPTVVNYNRKVHVNLPPLPGRIAVRQTMKSVGLLVLEAWVGPALGRVTRRPPCPDGEWRPEEIDSPQILHWSGFEPTDDLSIYLGTEMGRYTFDRWWTGPSDGYVYQQIEGTDRYRKVPKPRGQYQLRDGYQKISHPQLTEVNQAPMLPVPSQE